MVETATGSLFQVTACDISKGVIEAAKRRFDALVTTYKEDGVAGALQGKTDEALTRLQFSNDLAEESHCPVGKLDSFDRLDRTGYPPGPRNGPALS